MFAYLQGFTYLQGCTAFYYGHLAASGVSTECENETAHLLLPAGSWCPMSSPFLPASLFSLLPPDVTIPGVQARGTPPRACETEP